MPNPRNVFAVFGAIDPAALDQVVQSKFIETDRYKIRSGEWLIADATTLSAEIYNKISPNKGELQCIVVPLIGQYYGWQSNALWSWISAQKNG
jgi:hypothetical protein